MNKNNKLKDIYTFLRDKGLLVELINRTGVSRATMLATFENERYEELKGKQLLTFKEAVRMVEEINELPRRAEEALGK